MKLVIFGAAGGTGRILIEQALAKGYTVTAFDRHPEFITVKDPRLTCVKGDVFHLDEVEAAIAGQDAVLCALGVKAGTTIPVCSEGTKNIVQAMQKTGVKRFICQSGFMVAALDGEHGAVSWVFPLILPFFPKTKQMFADKVLQEEYVHQSALDWVIVRPARLTDDSRTGAYRAGDPLKIGLKASISRADVADFMLQQVVDDTYLHKTPRLTY